VDQYSLSVSAQGLEAQFHRTRKNKRNPRSDWPRQSRHLISNAPWCRRRRRRLRLLRRGALAGRWVLEKVAAWQLGPPRSSPPPVLSPRAGLRAPPLPGATPPPAAGTHPSARILLAASPPQVLPTRRRASCDAAVPAPILSL
jgi:hypothetical protein